MRTPQTNRNEYYQLRGQSPKGLTVQIYAGWPLPDPPSADAWRISSAGPSEVLARVAAVDREITG
jgi:hypothetical protein